MNIAVRLIWFTFVGWWLGLFWLGLSIALMISIIFFPIGAWAATKTWKVMTLAGSDSPTEAVNDITVDVENKIEQEIGDNNSEEGSDSSSEAERLKDLKELKEEDVITDEEYEEKKDDLMDEL